MNATEFLLLRAAGSPYAVRAAHVLAVHDDVVTERIPGTRHWFLGIAVVNGQLLPITDLGAFLHADTTNTGIPTHSTSRCLLQLRDEIARVGLAIDSIHGVCAGDTSPAGQSEISFNDQRWQVLDLDSLLSSHRFIAIGEAAT